MTHRRSESNREQDVDDLGRIDIDRARSDTPGVADLAHFNNAGASLPPRQVVDAFVDYIRGEAAVGGYEHAAANVGAINRVYDEGARLLGCDTDELAFQQSASQAWWAAFNSVPLNPGDRVLATTAEYATNGLGLLRAKARGIDVVLIPNDESGQVSVAALSELLDERVKLVCATHVPTSSGLINPAAAIGSAVKMGSDAFYLLDAAQSVGQLRLEVSDLKGDFLALTGRKYLRGPRGTGILFQRRGLTGLRPPAAVDTSSGEWTGPWTSTALTGARAHQLFECGFGAKVAFGVALAYANELGPDNIAARVQALGAILRDSLAGVDGVIVADRGVEMSGIVTFEVAGNPPSEVVEALRAQGINTSESAVGAAQFDLAERAPNGVVRASVHYFNTEEEVKRLAGAVAALIH